MKKTAMQLAIEHYEKLSFQGSNQAYVVAKFLKENYLEMEKQQLIDFHIEVMKKGLFEEGIRSWKDDYLPIIRFTANELYKETFELKSNESEATKEN